MIKQLQLRGISRSPSDRATPDGGCAESLNIHLEEGESAPTLPAEDLADKLQWEYPEGKYIYIHKGQNYEKYIYISDVSVKAASVNGEPESLFDLVEDEEVIDISHVGNTLVVLTNKRMQYILHRDGEYVNLGDHVPMPIVEFKCNQYLPGYGAKRPGGDDAQKVLSLGQSVSTMLLEWTESGTGSDTATGARLGREAGTHSSSQSRSSEYEHDLLKWRMTSWDKFINGEYDTVNNDMKADFAMINDSVWSMIKGQITAARKQGYFGAPLFVRYALRLYDGTYIYQSVPILIGAGDEEFFTARGRVFHDVNNKHYSYVEAKLVSGYKAFAYLKPYSYDGWDDIVESIDLFISTDIYNPQVNEDVKKVEKDTDASDQTNEYFNLSFSAKDADEREEAIKREVLSKTNFYKIASFKVGGTSRLEEGYDLANMDDKFLLDTIGSQDYLVLQEELPDDYQTHHKKTAESIFHYNNKVIISSISQEISRGYPFMCGETTRRDLTHFLNAVTYELRFFMKDPSGTELMVWGNNTDGGKRIPVRSCQYATYNQSTGLDYVTVYGRAYAWIAYPDPRCYLVEVIHRNGNTIMAKTAYEMETHPGLNCSYVFVGLDKQIATTTDPDDSAYWARTRVEKRVFHEDNIVWASIMNNPFVFPLDGRLTFNSGIIGMAAVTTPLSEGQAGQFDMYVFTGEGIHALKNNSIGDFVFSHIVSREVAINKSILGFEQTVIFVSDKGVMMLQGSQVTNLSPEMTGRHYTLEQDVANILSVDTSWSGFVPAVSDNTPFMAFMRDAKIAYDYKGGRLIFFNDEKPYQYVYMFGTASWHKLLGSSGEHGILNSYPDCIVAKNSVIGTRYIFNITYLANDQTAIDQFKETIEEYAVEPQAGQDFDNAVQALVVYDEPIVAWTENPGGAEDMKAVFDNLSEGASLVYDYSEVEMKESELLDYSTVLDDAAVLSDEADPVKGIIVTRPFDLGEPDIRKAIKSIRIRGKYDRGNVKYILCGSMDGIHWKRLTSFRGGSCNLYRLVILANISPTERITWVDVDYETRFADKLR